MNLAIYLSLSSSANKRIELLSMLTKLHQANALSISIVFVSGNAALELASGDPSLSTLLADLDAVKVCSTSAEKYPSLADNYSVDGLGSWVEASLQADRVMSL